VQSSISCGESGWQEPIVGYRRSYEPYHDPAGGLRFFKQLNPQLQTPQLIPRVLRWRAVGSYLGHGKPGIGFESGNRLLKLEFKFVLFLLKVVGWFRHDPNGTPSGPSTPFTNPVNGTTAPDRRCTLADSGRGVEEIVGGHRLNLP
jgi:hypothetical protein